MVGPEYQRGRHQAVVEEVVTLDIVEAVEKWIQIADNVKGDMGGARLRTKPKPVGKTPKNLSSPQLRSLILPN